MLSFFSKWHLNVFMKCTLPGLWLWLSQWGQVESWTCRGSPSPNKPTLYRSINRFSPILCTRYIASSCPREFSATHRKKYPDLAGGKNRLLTLDGTCEDGFITLRGTRRHFFASGVQLDEQVIIGCWNHLKWGIGWPRNAVDWIVVAAPKAKTRKSVSFFLFSTGFSGKYKEENPRKKLKTKKITKTKTKTKTNKQYVRTRPNGFKTSIQLRSTFFNSASWMSLGTLLNWAS